MHTTDAHIGSGFRRNHREINEFLESETSADGEAILTTDLVGYTVASNFATVRTLVRASANRDTH